MVPISSLWTAHHAVCVPFCLEFATAKLRRRPCLSELAAFQ
jgi:hypothetical protein